jgi:phosphoribosyl 1,2-cyclic phosphodiesterase
LGTAALNHPDDALGYRLTWKGKSLCYVTDTEHKPGTLDEQILGLIEGADMVIYDASYTDEEWPEHISWGHSTWQEGLRLCRKAGAKSLFIFHHDPSHTDDVMDQVAQEASREWPHAFVAKQGMTVDL